MKIDNFFAELKRRVDRKPDFWESGWQ